MDNFAVEENSYTMWNVRKGCVYIIGAGPGDPLLLTIKAVRILGVVDVIVHDRLITDQIKDYFNPMAEVIDVGKEPGLHVITQDGINKILYEQAKSKRSVARLKGGDPFIFGRGGEEAEYLAKKSVRFEVIPGLSSAIAVPAYAGIPLTYRGIASAVTIITGHQCASVDNSLIDWEIIARSSSTLVFLMPVKNISHIVEKLIENGKSPLTPSALIMWGTTGKQKTIISDLKNAPSFARDAEMGPPSVFVVGDVVSLRQKIYWFEKLPLFGKTIILTRSKENLKEMMELFCSLGANVIEIPTIRINKLITQTGIKELLPDLEECNWVVFTSATGVKLFWHELNAAGLDARMLSGSKVVAIGPETGRLLKAHGIIADYIPESFTSAATAELIIDKGRSGQNVLLLRAKGANEILSRKLVQAGFEVREINHYETVCEEPDGKTFHEMLINRIDYVIFSSSSTVLNFFKLLEGMDIGRMFLETKFACIGPVTELTLKSLGFDAHIVAKSHTFDGLTEAILADVRGNRQIEGTS
ncbi:MAG: uroporphyrinogen-III C-methyltransferase [Actinobacteria bacterium]|nr:uroporphyrinogen-III C-methyltransferase [Actinomycetota bacterium]